LRTNEKNILLGALAVVVILSLTGALNLGNLWPGTTPGVPGQTGDDWTTVNRLLDFAATDKYAGSASASKTIYVYDGVTLLETLTTTSDGTIATANPYPTGKVLNIKYVDSNAKMWFVLTVPKMLKIDAQSTTSLNSIPVATFQAETFTDLLSKGSTTYADSATFNYTSVGDTGTLVYSWAAVTDNRAILSSPKDPVYNCEYQTTMFIVLSAGDYDKCILNSMDGMYATGSARVYWKHLADSDFICWKQGTSYVSTGSGAVSIPYDVSGMSNTATTNTTMQIYILSYSSPTYAAHYSATGSTASAYGPDAVELMETTLTLYT
jgi:hypothetical protein